VVGLVEAVEEDGEVVGVLAVALLPPLVEEAQPELIQTLRA
jgi:hypothetical protein